MCLENYICMCLFVYLFVLNMNLAHFLKSYDKNLDGEFVIPVVSHILWLLTKDKTSVVQSNTCKIL